MAVVWPMIISTPIKKRIIRLGKSHHFLLTFMKSHNSNMIFLFFRIISYCNSSAPFASSSLRADIIAIKMRKAKQSAKRREVADLSRANAREGKRGDLWDCFDSLQFRSLLAMT